MHGFIAFCRLDERANCCRCRVKNADLVVLDHFPKAACIGKRGYAFKHNLCAAQSQRSIGNIGVACHPPDVGGTPKHVVGLQVKCPLGGEGGMHQITTGAVLHTFGFASRPRCIQQEQRVFRLNPLGCTGGGLLVCHIGQPQIATGMHGDVGA